MGDWTFFSNYGHVLVCLARSREVRLRDVAAEVGITERAVQKIVRDLQDADYLTISKQGRCNRYRINRRKTLRHSLESHCTVGKLLTLLAKPARARPEKQAESKAVELSAGEDSPVKQEVPPRQQPIESLSEKPKLKSRKKVVKKESESKPLDTKQQGSLF